MIPHAAVICLYEPFADISDPNDGPSRRILSAAQAIVSMLQNLSATLPGGMGSLSDVLHSSASVCLVTAARTSLIYYRHALNQQDMQTAEWHRMDIETVRLSLESFGKRFKVSERILLTRAKVDDRSDITILSSSNTSWTERLDQTIKNFKRTTPPIRVPEREYFDLPPRRS